MHAGKHVSHKYTSDILLVMHSSSTKDTSNWKQILKLFQRLMQKILWPLGHLKSFAHSLVKLDAVKLYMGKNIGQHLEFCLLIGY